MIALGSLLQLAATMSHLDVNEPSSTCLQSLLPPSNVHLSLDADDPWFPIIAANRSFSVSSTCAPTGAAPPPAAYLIVSCTGDLEKQLELLSCNHLRWYPDRPAVVLFRRTLSGPTDEQHLVRAVIAILWRYGVLSCVVLFYGDSQVYRADPFAEGNQCGHSVTHLTRGACLNPPIAERQQYPRCILSVSARDTFPFSFRRSGEEYGDESGERSGGEEYGGPDAELARLIAERSGLVLSWSTRPSPQSMASFSIAHAYYTNVSRNEIDLAIGGSVLSIRYFFNVTYAKSHASEILMFYLARDKPLRGWRLLVAMFSESTWLLILLALVTSCAALSLFGPADRSKQFLLVLGILIERPVKLPRGRLRLFLLAIVCPFFSLSSLYTTYLHSYTMNPPLSAGIHDFKDLLRANLSIMLSSSNKLVTDVVQNKLVRSILENEVVSPGLEQSLALLQQRQDFAILDRDMAIRFVINKKGYDVRSIPYPVTVLRNGLVFPKGSLFGRRINRLVQRCIEYGLCHKWIKDVLGRRKSDLSSFHLRAINLNDVAFAFTILLFGHCTSLLAYSIEILVSSLSKREWSFFRFSKSKLGSGHLGDSDRNEPTTNVQEDLHLSNQKTK